jgi:hypothetical protein
MVPPQTSQILLGATVALLYATAMMAMGILLLEAFMGRQASATARGQIGILGFAWLGFVIGQGVLGVLWLILSLAGNGRLQFAGVACILGLLLACAIAFVNRRQMAQAIVMLRAHLKPSLRSNSWFFWVGVGIIIVNLFHGLIALLPTSNDDALKYYLIWPKIVAISGKLDLYPFLHPFYGLLPKQVEIHWAALFTISNETSVAVWDYLCALSFLGGIGFLAWSLTYSRRVALLAILMMLSTQAFYDLMGGGKPDNAAAQYGIAAFLCLTIWPAQARKAVILAGLCAGWAMSSRYTNVIIIPALIIFAFMVLRRASETSQTKIKGSQLKDFWMFSALAAGIAAAVAGAPMLLKNWLLVGCPLAPQVGCQGAFWAGIYKNAHADLRNLSITDLPFYPFVWTFAGRTSMLGNISPLFVGFFPFLPLTYHCFSIERAALKAGLAGLTSVMTWLLIMPLALHTRWLLVPLGLLAIPLSAAFVAAEQGLRKDRTVRWLARSSVLIVLLFLMFEGRAVIYAARYLASIDDRAARYESAIGYDVAAWLNTHAQMGQRVALGGYLVITQIFARNAYCRKQATLSPLLATIERSLGMLSPPCAVSLGCPDNFNSCCALEHGKRKSEKIWVMTRVVTGAIGTS